MFLLLLLVNLVYAMSYVSCLFKLYTGNAFYVSLFTFSKWLLF